MNPFELADYSGYSKQKDLIDLCVLTLANREHGCTLFDISCSLFDCEIGNGTHKERLALAYSSTGAIARAAVTEMLRAGLIRETIATPPYACHATPKGIARLADLMPSYSDANEDAPLVVA